MTFHTTSSIIIFNNYKDIGKEEINRIYAYAFEESLRRYASHRPRGRCCRNHQLQCSCSGAAPLSVSALSRRTAHDFAIIALGLLRSGSDRPETTPAYWSRSRRAGTTSCETHLSICVRSVRLWSDWSPLSPPWIFRAYPQAEASFSTLWGLRPISRLSPWDTPKYLRIFDPLVSFYLLRSTSRNRPWGIDSYSRPPSIARSAPHSLPSASTTERSAASQLVSAPNSRCVLPQAGGLLVISKTRRHLFF